jgi:membrane associated rhomboid family serine protease
MPPDSQPPRDAPPAAEEWVPIATPPGRATRWLAALQSAGIPCEPDPEAHDVLRVPPARLQRALAELREYETINADWPPPQATPEHTETPGAAIWSGFLVVLLLWFHAVTGESDGGGTFFDAGMLAVGRIQSGEWWRAVTALTLHADFPHVAANAAALFALGLAASHELGPGMAWLVAFAGGVGGNLLEAMLTNPDRRSLGASTAVFALLATLAAMRFVAIWRKEGAPRSVWARSWLPPFAALACLGFLGTSHGSDVAGHTLGFVSGGLLGLGIAFLPRRKLGDAWQFVLCALPLAAVVWAWHVALNPSG